MKRSQFLRKWLSSLGVNWAYEEITNVSNSSATQLSLPSTLGPFLSSFTIRFIPEKKWIPPTDSKCLPSDVRFSHGDGERRCHLQTILYEESPAEWVSMKRIFYSKTNVSSLIQIQDHPFPNLPYGLAYECPEWRSWWETGELSPAAETSQSLPNCQWHKFERSASWMQVTWVYDDFWSNKMEDVVEIKMN